MKKRKQDSPTPAGTKSYRRRHIYTGIVTTGDISGSTGGTGTGPGGARDDCWSTRRTVPYTQENRTHVGVCCVRLRHVITGADREMKYGVCAAMMHDSWQSRCAPIKLSFTSPFTSALVGFTRKTICL